MTALELKPCKPELWKTKQPRQSLMNDMVTSKSHQGLHAQTLDPGQQGTIAIARACLKLSGYSGAL